MMQVTVSMFHIAVIPAQAGIHCAFLSRKIKVDPGFRRDDDGVLT
jgi:hypothetical protein